MADVTMRLATRADLPAVVAMLADDILGPTREAPGLPLDPRYLAAFDAIAANPLDMLAVAVVDGAVVGCLQLTFLPGLSYIGGLRGQIEGVRVASTVRGGGVGRQMLLWAVERCRARGCFVVQLTTNALRTDARRFYEGLGFEPANVGMKLVLA